MNRRVWAVIAAVVLAIVGTAAVFAYVRGADNRAIAGQEVTDVLVAAKDVPVGTTAQQAVDKGLVVKEAIASKGVPDGAMTTVDASNADLIATSNIVAGQIVLSDLFATTAAAPGTLAIPDGQMAVSIALLDPAHVGTFVQAGSQIAVFDSFNINERAGGRTPAGDHLQDNHTYTRATRILLPRVTVLAVGATTTPTTPDSSSQDQSSAGQQVLTLVTVAVTQAQAEKLIQGTQTGTLYLGLINAQTKVSPTIGVDDRTLFTGRG
jgi:pilus assembly protein CpaB